GASEGRCRAGPAAPAALFGGADAAAPPATLDRPARTWACPVLAGGAARRSGGAGRVSPRPCRGRSSGAAEAAQTRSKQRGTPVEAAQRAIIEEPSSGSPTGVESRRTRSVQAGSDQPGRDFRQPQV